MLDKTKYLVHLINVKTNEKVGTPIMVDVPKVGDEIRYFNNKFYTVTMVVWCLDEPESLYNRVNLGVVELKRKRKSNEETENGNV